MASDSCFIICIIVTNKSYICNESILKHIGYRVVFPTSLVSWGKGILFLFLMLRRALGSKMFCFIGISNT